ncbi:uncharacterized protein LOC126354475 [Schistocerca gregaria]|uniref:uncharacterized protein LOC126354475 n=1 Tax=Schistocerca gregaria TaxID=7010 RepID=UPI00211DAA62|nr:uncharacterized protein LOC126354475 [Schistocerca gregaria]
MGDTQTAAVCWSCQFHMPSRGTMLLRLILFLCLLLSETANTTHTSTTPGVTHDDVTHYFIRREPSTLLSAATLATGAFRGAIVRERELAPNLGKIEGIKGNSNSTTSHRVRGAAAVAGGAKLIDNVWGDVSPLTTAPQGNDITSQNLVPVSTAMETSRRGGGHLSNLLSSHGSSEKDGDSGASEKGVHNALMMMMGTLVMGKMVMLMPMMLLKSASELLQSLLSLAMKVLEMAQKLLERNSEGRRGGRHSSGGGDVGRGSEATHKQVVVLQLPKDHHESWVSDHSPHAVEHDNYGGEAHPGHGWSEEYALRASSYHPQEWSPHAGGGGWRVWNTEQRAHEHRRRRAGAPQAVRRASGNGTGGQGLAYRYWIPRAKPPTEDSALLIG